METGSNQIPDAFVRYKQQYEAAGKKFHCAEREYYSTGSVIFNVDGSPIVVGGQYDRYVLHAQPKQEAQLFAYKVGDPMQVANTFTADGAGTRVADYSDTNILRAYETNDEDFAVRGIGFRIKSFRLEFTPQFTEQEITSPFSPLFTTVVSTGTGYVDDPGSHVVPPEVDSPLVLQDTLGRAISQRLRIREVWDNRASDDIALARRMGPAGSDSYLKSLGDPKTWNVLRLDPGLMWNRPNAEYDTRFNLSCTLEEDIWSIVSWPQSVVAANLHIGPLKRIHVDYSVILVGHAFYYPSANA
jgi:hypothetical protein